MGLAAARSRSRSDSPPDCHSFRSRRFATCELATAKARPCGARRLSVSILTIYFYSPLVRKFLKGVWGKLLLRSFPHNLLFLLQYFFAPSAFAAGRAHQMTGKTAVQSHHRFFVGRYNFGAAFGALISANAHFKFHCIKTRN